MVSFSYITLNVNIGDNIWKTAALASGSIICVYTVYRFLKRQKRVDDVTRKCVFITGCDTGFGRALAKQLDALGCPVFAACLTVDGAKSLNNETSDSLKTLQLDVTSTESVGKAAEYVNANLPEGTVLWGVVNNAGVSGLGGPVEFQPRSEFEHVMAVNFLGMVDVIYHLMPQIKKSRGRIVNMASLAGLVPVPNITAYTASKFAVLGYSEALRREKFMWGIHVSTILPGMFATELTNLENADRKKNAQWDTLPDELKQEYGDDYVAKILESSKNSFSKTIKTDLSPVTNAIEHALFATKPQNLYKVGGDAKLLLFLDSLPFGIVDYLMSSPKFAQVPKVLQK